MHTPNCICLSRRHLLAGFGLAGAGIMLPMRAFAGSADAIVLTCMDYRIVDDAVNYFNSRGLRNKYDHVILAGAGVGALGKLGADWASTFWKHVETAIQLHHVEELIVVNHRDCGAVKIVFGPESIAVRAEETKLHRNLLHQLSGQVARKFPTLRTQMLLMDIDGSVEDVSGSPDEDVGDAAKAAPAAPAASSGH